MEVIEELKPDYNYLIDKFGQKKISSRLDWLEKLLRCFIEQRNYEANVVLSVDIIKHIIIDYFVDIDRLKEFQEIEIVHDSKIYAYLSFWILRHKPIQVIKETGAMDLVYVNEEFVCYFIRSYLFLDNNIVSILPDDRDSIDDFMAEMLYYFQYRDFSAKSIEIMILAFEAGRKYQNSVKNQK